VNFGSSTQLAGKTVALVRQNMTNFYTLVVVVLLLSTLVHSKSVVDNIKEDEELLEEIEDLIKNRKNDPHQLRSNDEKESDGGKMPFDDILEANANRDDLNEGDMKPDPEEGVNTDDLTVKRNAVRDRGRLWHTRDIAYEIKKTDPFAVDSFTEGRIGDAMREISAKTCIKFHPRTSADSYYIQFFKESGCWSYVGNVKFQKGYQEVSIGSGCTRIGTVIHEILHALGFYHEQSRSDRNHFVEIFWENIPESAKRNFERQTVGGSDNLGTDYDFDGVMHYSNTAFGNGKTTIKVIGDPNRRLGQRNGMSSIDADQVNKLYECTTVGNGQAFSPWSQWSPCSAACSRSRERFCHKPNLADCNSNNRVEKETQDCAAEGLSCAIDGHWGRWSNWGFCSNPCGVGVQPRTRTCTEPPAANGGKPCPTKVNGDQQTRACDTTGSSCTVDLTCDFENFDACNWKNGKNNINDNWRKNSGSTVSTGTGPSGDYPSGSGTYMYFEASSPVQTNEQASLQSRPIAAGGPAQCFKFAYHMFGANM